MADQWYYTSNGQQTGPVPTAELKKLAASGVVQPTDLVWQEGTPNWIRASAAKGLFEDPASGERPAPADYQPRSDQRDPRRELRRRLPRSDDRDFDPDRPRRRTSSNGMSSGAKVAIILGVVALIVGSMVGGIVLIVNSSNDQRNNFIGVKGKKDGVLKVGGGPTVYVANILRNGSDVRNFEFKGNTLYEFQIAGDAFCDLDLVVTDANTGNTLIDQAGPVFLYSWVAPYTGTFRVEWIQAQDNATRATVTIRDLGPGFANNFNPPPVKKDGGGKKVKPGPGPAPVTAILNVGIGGVTRTGTIDNLDPLDPGGFDRAPHHVFQVRMEVGRTYQIDLMSKDFDAYLRLENSAFQQLADDDDGGEGLNSRIIFACNQTDNYRVICRPLVNGSGRYTLKIQRR
jgi:hypothetical protein